MQSTALVVFQDPVLSVVDDENYKRGGNLLERLSSIQYHWHILMEHSQPPDLAINFW